MLYVIHRLVIHRTSYSLHRKNKWDGWRTELNDRLQKKSAEALLRRSSWSPRKETMDSSPLGELGWKWLPVKQNFKKSRRINSNFVIVKVIIGIIPYQVFLSRIAHHLGKLIIVKFSIPILRKGVYESNLGNLFAKNLLSLYRYSTATIMLLLLFVPQKYFARLKK